MTGQNARRWAEVERALAWLDTLDPDVKKLVIDYLCVIVDAAVAEEVKERDATINHGPRGGRSLSSGGDAMTPAPGEDLSYAELLRLTEGHGTSEIYERIQRRLRAVEGKYHEAMEILTRWENIDGADAVAKLAYAEQRVAGLEAALRALMIAPAAEDSEGMVTPEWNAAYIAARKLVGNPYE